MKKKDGEENIRNKTATTKSIFIYLMQRAVKNILAPSIHSRMCSAVFSVVVIEAVTFSVLVAVAFTFIYIYTYTYIEVRCGTHLDNGIYGSRSNETIPEKRRKKKNS